MQSSSKIEILERALQREKAARKAAETILEEKSSELFELSEALKKSNNQLEDLLNRKTSELEGVFENIIDAYVVMELSGEVIRMNQAAVDLLGYDVEQEAVNLIKLVKEDYLEYTFEVFRELVIHGNFNDYKAVIQTKHNGEKIVQINASVIYNSAGEPIAAQGIARDITEDTRLKNMLEDQKQRLDIIFENSPIGVGLAKTLDSGLILSNKAMCKMLGYSSKELKELNVKDLIHPEDRQRTKILHNKVSTGEMDTFRMEKRYVKKDGNIVWANTAVTAVRDHNDNIDYLVATIEDITHKKQAFLQLQESENRMSTLIINLQTAILLEDEHKRIRLTNKKFCEMFNIPAEPEHLIGQDCSNAAEESKAFFEEPENFVKRIDEMLEIKKTVIGEELKLKDGRIFERSYIPIFNEGIYKGHLWSYEDITIRKRYREGLTAQKEKYSNIIANMNLGLIELDRENKILMANQSFTEISGYQELELQGQNAEDLLFTDAYKASLTEKKKKRIANMTEPYEAEIKTKNGQVRNWLISAAPNYNESGATTGSIGIYLDITDRKKLEEKQIELFQNLEKQNVQLNEYAHIVSHDLKSPLRNISALLSWTKEDFRGKLGEESLTNLNLMQDKVEKMDHLIENILKYSTIEKGSVSEELVDVHSVVEDIIFMIYVPDHIEVNISSQLPTIMADTTRIQQLFQNLISNAVNYIDKDKGLVEISVTEESEEYVFSIKDNGCGIPKEYHQKIFKIFTSVSNCQNSTGIGLSIVKKIVDLYQGRIWLESTPGEGTSFFFSIKK